ncbi:dihydrodipicolinate synthase family protein [Haloechinothrix salitolerans]|uniref:Dihydrodipicolinate synthase family protein n=1 Tax=Haloechinothrix salitolerans TaxID=926830 RepID=A0ABW2BXC4_9PSEU
MSTVIRLPGPDGPREHLLREPVSWPQPDGPPRSRIAFAAAHVVADPLRDDGCASIDWDNTLAFRRYLWSYGLGVAEAMDTAQRGMGLDWTAARELIRRSAAEAAALDARIAAGAGTDQLVADPANLDDVVRAYVEQVECVQDARAQVVVMASRQLARLATSPADYRYVYDRVLAQASEPVVLHWLGPMFDPALTGYWGASTLNAANEVFLELVHDHARVIDGVKVSLLDAEHERALRSALPEGVRIYTGDDFHYPELIKGDDTGGSDALLGVLAAIAPAASRALHALDDGDLAGYDEVLGPTVPLARHLFSEPTYNYKAGIAFLAWLSGLQPGFTMIGGLQGARGLPHLVEAFRLADAAGVLVDPDVAVYRMNALLDVHGVNR